MKAGGGKQKGSSFERKICKLLSLWYSDNKRDDIFYRSASSGAMSTIRFKKGKNTCNQSGDITSSDPDGIKFINEVSIECKSYKTFGFEFLLFDKPSVILTWWLQANDDANISGKIPLLIIKRNNVPELIIFNRYFKSIILSYCGTSIKITSFTLNNEILYITTLSDFLTLNPEAIKLGLGILE